MNRFTLCQISSSLKSTMAMSPAFQTWKYIIVLMNSTHSLYIDFRVSVFNPTVICNQILLTFCMSTYVGNILSFLARLFYQTAHFWIWKYFNLVQNDLNGLTRIQTTYNHRCGHMIGKLTVAEMQMDKKCNIIFSILGTKLSYETEYLATDVYSCLRCVSQSISSCHVMIWATGNLFVPWVTDGWLRTNDGFVLLVLRWY